MSSNHNANSQQNESLAPCKAPKSLRVALSILLVFLVVVCLIGLSLRVVLIPLATKVVAEQTVNDQLSVLPHDKLVEVAKSGRDFVDSAQGSKLPTGDDARTAFPADVVSHMEDVRTIISAAAYITLISCLLLFLTLFVCCRCYGRRLVGKALFVGGITTVVLVSGLVVVGALSFDALFATMHKLLFADGTWTFAADSLLICAYPIAFWLGMALLWASALFILSAATFVVGYFLKKRPRQVRKGSQIL